MDIELRDLCVAFDGRPVLRHLNCILAEHSITCVTGPSGCGKTTLLRVLLGLVAPDSGQILGLPDRSAAVFQEDRLISHLSPADNVRIALPHGFSPARIQTALTAVGLAQDVRRPIHELSGGMRRRVAIVRALLTDAPLLVMDEPFKGLDAATRDKVIQFARPLLAGRTCVVVTHDPTEATLLNGTIFQINQDG